MSKKTDALLAKAKEVENPSQELVDAIATFEGVNGITANHAEYDVVQDLMVAIEATEEAEEEVDGAVAKAETKVETESDDESDDEADTDSDASNKAEQEEAEAPKKRVSMKGIKMIGNRWHHADDNYAKSFDTPQECAEHFNGE